MLDADGAWQEEQFGADLVADECASRRLGRLILFDHRKSNDDKAARGEYLYCLQVRSDDATAYRLARADWTHSSLRRPNRLYAEPGKTQAGSTTVE
jgi:hypothetical protein